MGRAAADRGEGSDRARCRILVAPLGEHSRPDVNGVHSLRLLRRRTDVAEHAPNLLELRLGSEGLGVVGAALEGLAAAQLREDERQPHAGSEWRMPRAAYVRLVQPDGGRDLSGAEGRGQGCPWLGRGERRADGAAVSTQNLEGHQASLLLEHHAVADGRTEALAAARQHRRRADVRMARERHLGRRREDPHAGSVGWVGGRHHERRLGVVELAGDLEHLRRAQLGAARRQEADGEGVAAKVGVGEHIDGLVVNGGRHRGHAAGPTAVGEGSAVPGSAGKAEQGRGPAAAHAPAALGFQLCV